MSKENTKGTANEGYVVIQKGYKPTIAQDGYKPATSEAPSQPPNQGSGVKPGTATNNGDKK